MTLLLTMQRRQELALAKKTEFDLEKRTWSIPDEHAKKGRGHVLPLSDWAVEEIRSLLDLSSASPYLLPRKFAQILGELCPPSTQRWLSDIEPLALLAHRFDDDMDVRERLIGMQHHRVSVLQSPLIRCEPAHRLQHLGRRRTRRHGKNEVVDQLGRAPRSIDRTLGLTPKGL
jgi:integrase